MQRKSVLIALMMALAFSLAAVIVNAGDSVPDVVTINKAQAKKAPVTLPHKQHGDEFGCQSCHHGATGDVKPENCFNCHGKDPGIPDPSAMSTKQNPFHITCLGCHKEKGKGPAKCAECHKE